MALQPKSIIIYSALHYQRAIPTSAKYNNSRYCLLCPLHASLALGSYNSATIGPNNFN